MRTEPESVVKTDEGTLHYHPSYAVVNFSRCSGSANLYDSEIDHQHYIMLRLAHAHTESDDYSDRVVTDDHIIEIKMSETQFARAITSMNMGQGIPCTINRLNNVSFPEPPRKQSLLRRNDKRIEEFAKKTEDTFTNIKTQIKELREAKKRPTLKQMDQMLFDLRVAEQNMAANAEFAHTMLSEAAEDAVASAKAEVDGYVSHTILMSGLRGLESSQMINLEDNSKK